MRVVAKWLITSVPSLVQPTELPTGPPGLKAYLWCIAKPAGILDAIVVGAVAVGAVAGAGMMGAVPEGKQLAKGHLSRN